MKKSIHRILTINGGSSSIKFALFEAGDLLRRILESSIERIRPPDATLMVKDLNKANNFTRSMTAANHTEAVELLRGWIEERIRCEELTAVGHRVVHGGPKYSEPQRITTEMVEELHQLQPFDPEHLPEEILLAEAFHRRFLDLVQVACFDTAFHHDLPRVAQVLPIPRRFEALGVRRYGFHGLSYAFLIEELARLTGSKVAGGRVILATSATERAWPQTTRANLWIPAWTSHRRGHADEYPLRRSRSQPGLVSSPHRKHQSEKNQ